jgi:cysteinyl-tRNA synthetase
MLSILGLAPHQWSAGVSEEHQALDALVKELISQRNAARDAKDFETADRIRDQLLESGIELSDSSNGTHWSLS